MLYIARNEGVSQAEVAAWLDIEPIALVRMLDKLHEEGLVERRAHPTDRRVRTLWLTPGAQPVVERILDINQAIREEAFAGLEPGTRDAMIAALGSIKDNLTLEEEAAEDRHAHAADFAAEPPPARPVGRERPIRCRCAAPDPASASGGCVAIVFGAGHRREPSA